MRIRGVELALSDNGTGPPNLLWGHGFASSMSSETAGLLGFAKLARNARVVRWDARGHGQSGGAGGPEDYRWDSLGLDALELGSGLGMDRFAVGGVSMGAATALYAAVAAPERISGLVLALPPTGYELREAGAADYRRGADIVETDGVDAYVQRANSGEPPGLMASLPASAPFVPEVADSLLATVLRGAAASDLPARDKVASITAPTLILAWIDDDGHPLAIAEELASLIQGSTLVVACSLDAVFQWTDKTASFLATLS